MVIFIQTIWLIIQQVFKLLFTNKVCAKCLNKSVLQMHIFMFPNKRAMYDLSCLSAENRFYYLLQREIYFVLYKTRRCKWLKDRFLQNAWIDDL